jgi:broad specificity phosphatase PhoE
MKALYLLRHAEKDAAGELTIHGQHAARELGRALPKFATIVSSPSSRARLTGRLLTGKESIVDDRAGFATAPADKSDNIMQLARSEGLTFLAAADRYNDPEVLGGIESKARQLNELVDEILNELSEGEFALLVTHNLSIGPAMELRGRSRESVGFLGGYIISSDGSLKAFPG